ncbi:MAG: DinB family protein [Anaerolineales bacterium]
MSETSAFLAVRLKTEGEKAAAFFASLTDAQWQASLYTEGATWNVISLLAHFVTVEQSFAGVFANVCAGGPGAPEDFDIDAYNAAQQQQTVQLSPQELLEQFNIARANMIAFVETLSAADLEKRGRHPFLGVITLAEMIKALYIHGQTHLRDLRRVLSSVQ